jgi:hypothetical protein
VEAQTANSNNNATNQQDDVGRYIRDKLLTLSMGKEHQKVKFQYKRKLKRILVLFLIRKLKVLFQIFHFQKRLVQDQQ